ncbi:Hypothetical predicted protein [Paramuricea clavata]|uniref:Uncharacterized protein n=1 Tax=Paramuricea clavata TaxID=317549 RepID=A0A6S7FLR2_PARCT|nr:Hypothetical predicted protein [Paramuricea clavata]
MILNSSFTVASVLRYRSLSSANDIVAKTTKGHESENLLLQQISEKQGNIPVESCVNCAQTNESSYPVTKNNSVTKQEAKLTHLHQVGLKQLSNNSKNVNEVINNNSLSGKLNPDSNNKQNYGHPSTSQKITYKSVNGENRVTTPRPPPPVTKHEAKLTHLHQDGLKQLSSNSKNVNDVINNKVQSGKSNPDIVNNRQYSGHPSTSQKITHRSVNGENRVPTPRPASPEWLKCLPLFDTPYNESSNNPVFRGIFGRRKTRWRFRREKYSDIVN